MSETDVAGSYVDLLDSDGRQVEGASTASRGDGGGHQAFVVTVRTPAGFEHRFRVGESLRVEVVTRRAVDYFVVHGELADGRYHLALLRHGELTDLVASSRLGDYGVRKGDVLVLIVGDPQVDG
jgi:hypothetical protein